MLFLPSFDLELELYHQLSWADYIEIIKAWLNAFTGVSHGWT